MVKITCVVLVPIGTTTLAPSSMHLDLDRTLESVVL
jgi:hypothetical protein